MRSLLDKHLQEKSIRHHRLLVKNVTANAQQNSHLLKVFEILEDQLSNLRICVANLEKDHDDNAEHIKGLEERKSKF